MPDRSRRPVVWASVRSHGGRSAQCPARAVRYGETTERSTESDGSTQPSDACAASRRHPIEDRRERSREFARRNVGETLERHVASLVYWIGGNRAQVTGGGNLCVWPWRIAVSHDADARF